MNTSRQAFVALGVATALAGICNTLAPRTAPLARAATGPRGTITITNKAAYSNTSSVDSYTANTTCTARMTINPDGSASASITYTHQSVRDRTNNGYETKTSVTEQGTATVSYDGGLRVSYGGDGSYTFGFSEPTITAKRTTTTETTGQKTQSDTISVSGITCSYDPEDLVGQIGSGTTLHRVAIHHGHYGGDGEEYGSSTVEWTITDPTIRSISGRPALATLLDTYPNGTITIDDSGSYSSNSAGDTYNSQTSCTEQITVAGDGSATDSIDYSFTSTRDQTNNGFETKTSVTEQGSAQVSSYDGGLRVSYGGDGTYTFSFSKPTISVQRTTTTETTGQQTQSDTITVSGITCLSDPIMLQGKIEKSRVLQGSATENAHTGDGQDYGPIKITWQITDPNLQPQAPVSSPTASPTTVGPQPTATTPQIPTSTPRPKPTQNPRPTPRPQPTRRPRPTPRPQPNPPGCELSGAQWVRRFPADNNVSALNQPFRGDVERFISALQRAGASVHIETVYRPDQRAYLMHYSWMVAHGTDARTVPRYKNNTVNICWAHYTATGVYDSRASRAAAQAMVSGYGIVYRPAYPGSNHSSRLAIDMSISWSGTLVVVDGHGQVVRITTAPRSGAGNAQLWRVGASYGVIKLVGDAPHWSANGH
jgi:hypothetical protein